MPHFEPFFDVNYGGIKPSFPSKIHEISKDINLGSDGDNQKLTFVSNF